MLSGALFGAAWWFWVDAVSTSANKIPFIQVSITGTTGTRSTVPGRLPCPLHPDVHRLRTRAPRPAVPARSFCNNCHPHDQLDEPGGAVQLQQHGRLRRLPRQVLAPPILPGAQTSASMALATVDTDLVSDAARISCPQVSFGSVVAAVLVLVKDYAQASRRRGVSSPVRHCGSVTRQTSSHDPSLAGGPHGRAVRVAGGRLRRADPSHPRQRLGPLPSTIPGRGPCTLAALPTRFLKNSLIQRHPPAP